jgi:magnesium-transporting ATPase (P-type)
MKRTARIMFLIFIVGLILLLLPDNNKPLLRFNKTHGPSAVDLAGLVLMFASWLTSCIIIINRRKYLTNALGRKNIYLLVTLYFLFLAGIVAALLLSFEWMLWVCVAAASVINIFFILLAFRTTESTG